MRVSLRDLSVSKTKKTAAEKIVKSSVLYLKFTNGANPGTVNITYACNYPSMKSQSPFVLPLGSLEENQNWNTRKVLAEWKGLADHMKGSTAPENHAFVDSFVEGRDRTAKKKLFDLVAEQVLMPMLEMKPDERKSFSKVIRFNVSILESYDFVLVHHASLPKLSSTSAFVYASLLTSTFPDFTSLENLLVTAALSEDSLDQDCAKALRTAYEMDMCPLGDTEETPVTSLNDYLEKLEQQEKEAEEARDEFDPLEYPELEDMQGEFEKVADQPLSVEAYTFVSLALESLEQRFHTTADVNVSDANIRPLHFLLPAKIEVNKSFTAKLPVDLLRTIQTKLIESGEASQEELSKLEENEEVISTVTLQTLEIPDYVKFLQEGLTVSKAVEVVYGPYNVTGLIEGHKIPLSALVAEA